MNPTTTLARIRDRSPCDEGWKKLLAGLGYKNGKFDPEHIISLGDVATTNNVQDAMWCVRALDWSDIAVRRAVIAGAVLPAAVRASKHTKDKRVHDAIADLQRWCNGDDTVDPEKVRLTAAAVAAAAAAYAAYADADEREQQRKDIIAAFPPIALAKKPS